MNIRPLKSKMANEVAVEVMKIFLIFGAPYILQSDNGRGFTPKVIEELITMWPDCKHGRSRRPETRQCRTQQSGRGKYDKFLDVGRKFNELIRWLLFLSVQKNA